MLLAVVHLKRTCQHKVRCLDVAAFIFTLFLRLLATFQSFGFLFFRYISFVRWGMAKKRPDGIDDGGMTAQSITTVAAAHDHEQRGHLMDEQCCT